MRETRAAEGTDGPLIPGDPERQAEQERRRDGIPLSDAVVKTLQETSSKTGVPW